MLTLAGGSVLVGGRFVDADVVVEGTEIAEITSGATHRGEILDCTDRFVVPGLIDLHVRGGGMRAFSSDVDESSYEAIARAHAATGTTALCPTITSGPLEEMLEALSLAADFCERQVPDGASFVGVHLEGPFLAPGRRGVHAEAHLLPPSIDIAERCVKASRGWLRMVTLAPELDGALEVIRYLAAQDVHVSAGHTDAGAAAMDAALTSGLGGVAPIFNDMAPLAGADPGPVGVTLSSNLYAGVIGDLIHVSRESLAALLHARPFGRTYLTTSAPAPLGTSATTYTTDDTTLVVRDGACWAPDGSLVGSVTTLSQMVRLLIRVLETPVDLAVAMATTVPAQLLGLRDCGRIRPGASADLLVIERHRVDSIVLRGEVIETFPNYRRL